MRLSRDKIQRMIDAGGGSSSGGGGGSDIAGGVTQAWVNQNYVSIEFFRKVFKVWAAGETSSDPDVELMPNDITTTVKNIQAQAGLWTEAFLSALGQGSGGGTGGATTLDQLDDVVITSPTNGQALIYNATTQMWVNGTIQSGTDMATVWSALAAATNEQINASHLSGVLADYVTTTSLQTILGDYLTQTAADQRYITIAYFDRLFRAYNGNTLVSHNDTTTTIDNIKAMFGFWTDMYLSALGRNSAATGLGLDNLTDVTINTPTDGQVLQYNANSAKWENATIQTVVALAGLTDVTLTSPSANQFLMYDAGTGKWINSDLKTINGQPLYGSGDISVGGGASGNYLPLTGGTLVGNLYIHNSTVGVLSFGRASFTWGGDPTEHPLIYGTNDNNVYTMIAMPHIPYLKSGNRGYSGSADGAIVRFEKGLNGGYWDILSKDDEFSLTNSERTLMFGMNTSGLVVLTSRNQWLNQAQLCFTRVDTQAKGYACIGVTSGNLHIDAYNGYDLFLNYYSGREGLKVRADGITQSIYDAGNGKWSNRIAAGATGVVFLGEYKGTLTHGVYGHNLSFSAWAPVGVGGSLIQFYLSGEPCGRWNNNGLGVGTDSPSYKLHVNGTIYATGAITALSDMREKQMNNKAELPIEWIANAPAFSYYWKDKKAHDELLHVGSSAQYWRTVLPEVVLEAKDEKGTLSMQYGVAALVSAITIARKVVDHEQRIKQLEQENEELKKQLNAA